MSICAFYVDLAFERHLIFRDDWFHFLLCSFVRFYWRLTALHLVSHLEEVLRRCSMGERELRNAILRETGVEVGQFKTELWLRMRCLLVVFVLFSAHFFERCSYLAHFKSQLPDFCQCSIVGLFRWDSDSRHFLSHLESWLKSSFCGSIEQSLC